MAEYVQVPVSLIERAIQAIGLTYEDSVYPPIVEELTALLSQQTPSAEPDIDIGLRVRRKVGRALVTYTVEKVSDTDGGVITLNDGYQTYRERFWGEFEPVLPNLTTEPPLIDLSVDDVVIATVPNPYPEGRYGGPSVQSGILPHAAPVDPSTIRDVAPPTNG